MSYYLRYSIRLSLTIPVDTKCPGEDDVAGTKTQERDCNKKPCVLTNVEQYKNEWYNKCTLSGDPHVKTFDNIWIDLMQYNQIYHLVNAYKDGNLLPTFVVKAKTSGTGCALKEKHNGLRNNNCKFDFFRKKSKKFIL